MHAVVLVVPAQLRTQRLVLLQHWVVPMRSTPLPDSLYRPTQSLPRCRPLDNPCPSSGPRPVVGESEKVECAFPTPSRLSAGFPELDQLCKSLWQYCHDGPSIGFLLAADYKIIGETNQKDAACHHRLSGSYLRRFNAIEFLSIPHGL